MSRPLLCALACLTLGACATVPKPLVGDYADTTPHQARTTAARTHVRWGGEVIRVEPGNDSTCFEILSHPLDDSAHPLRRDASEGRFVACRQGFYDPEVFTRGRDITVTGTLDGTEKRKVGEYDYVYPKVAADVIYLWPEPRYVRSYQPYPFYPFYGADPFWPGNFGGWGFWGPPPVVVVHRSHHGH
jgi:outer membrane lipoprotein